jgi:hypothetical protein
LAPDWASQPAWGSALAWLWELVWVLESVWKKGTRCRPASATPAPLVLVLATPEASAAQPWA